MLGHKNVALAWTSYSAESSIGTRMSSERVKTSIECLNNLLHLQLHNIKLTDFMIVESRSNNVKQFQSSHVQVPLVEITLPTL